MANWNPKIPLNFRTIVFCFLMGTVLSMPAGALLDSPFQIFTHRTVEYYETFCGFCLLLLPGWICVMSRCRWYTAFFVTIFFILLVGSMMPVMG